MVLITLILLTCLSILLYCAGAEKTPDALKGVLKSLTSVQEKLGAISIVWGILAVFASLVSLGYHSYHMLRLIASFMVLVMGLPFGIKLIYQYVKVDNPVLKENISQSIEKIEKNGKIFGIAGFVVAGLLLLSYY